MVDIEVFVEPTTCYLTEADTDWLASFGVDPSWHDDPRLVIELNELVSLGSSRLGEQANDHRYSEVISAREKFMDFVGIEKDTLAKLKKNNPTLITLDTFIGTQRAMQDLGLDAVKILHDHPAAIGLDPESVRAKVDNLTDLGLDAVKILHDHPAAIGYAPESVRTNIVLLERTTRVLHWDYTAKELIEAYPKILGFNKDKIKVLRRIAAELLDKQSRKASISETTGTLIVPLEKYMLALGDTNNKPVGITELRKHARQFKLDSAERKQKARTIVEKGNLGKIGTMYLAYRKYH